MTTSMSSTSGACCSKARRTRWRRRPSFVNGDLEPFAAAPTAESRTARRAAPLVEQSDVERVAAPGAWIGTDPIVVDNADVKLPESGRDPEWNVPVSPLLSAFEPPAQDDVGFAGGLNLLPHVGRTSCT